MKTNSVNHLSCSIFAMHDVNRRNSVAAPKVGDVEKKLTEPIPQSAIVHKSNAPAVFLYTDKGKMC